MDQSSGSTLAQVIPIAAIGLGLELRSYSQRLRSSGRIQWAVAIVISYFVGTVMALLSYWETNALNAVFQDSIARDIGMVMVINIAIGTVFFLPLFDLTFAMAGTIPKDRKLARRVVLAVTIPAYFLAIFLASFRFPDTHY
ncbi:hypothetical protein Rhe02_39190 [Rhizocola hellebori]|uniref:Uncharacterized protein n=1 Tax=Rhizocola hellebori TaxID=1392758 RepID=A0A8J3Q9K0_9ACTN|nr:hypothetical protein [Rhizocola hellebori]GIH05852.1 hypothetical protein Rhe02_39190 [Rhizocola hellebori]